MSGRQLAAADAPTSLSGHRRNQVWDAAALRNPPALLREAAIDEVEVALLGDLGKAISMADTSPSPSSVGLLARRKLGVVRT